MNNSEENQPEQSETIGRIKRRRDIDDDDDENIMHPIVNDAVVSTENEINDQSNAISMENMDNTTNNINDNYDENSRRNKSSRGDYHNGNYRRGYVHIPRDERQVSNSGNLTITVNRKQKLPGMIFTNQNL